MKIRTADFEDKKAKFMAEKCAETKAEISRVAMKEILIENNRRIQRERQQKTHEQLKKIQDQEEGEEAAAEANEWRKGTIK